MDEETFNDVVLEAINDLPEEFGRHLANVEVLVEAQPTPEHRRAARIHPWQTLYGLYQGVPLTIRQSGMVLMPDTITIFSGPLSHDFPSREQLRAQIRRTVLHEIAHVFGISDDRLRELDAY